MGLGPWVRPIRRRRTRRKYRNWYNRAAVPQRSGVDGQRASLHPSLHQTNYTEAITGWFVWGAASFKRAASVLGADKPEGDRPKDPPGCKIEERWPERTQRRLGANVVGRTSN